MNRRIKHMSDGRILFVKEVTKKDILDDVDAFVKELRDSFEDAAYDGVHMMVPFHYLEEFEEKLKSLRV